MSSRIRTEWLPILTGAEAGADADAEDEISQCVGVHGSSDWLRRLIGMTSLI